MTKNAKNKACFLVRRLDYGSNFKLHLLSSWNELTEEYSWTYADVDGRASWCLEKEINGERYTFGGRKFIGIFEPLLFFSKKKLTSILKIIRLCDSEDYKHYEIHNGLKSVSYYIVDTECRTVTVPSRHISSEMVYGVRVC